MVGGLQVAAGAMQLGDVQAFIQYLRQFTQPLAQLGSMANLLQSGVASAERVFELLDTEEQSPERSFVNCNDHLPAVLLGERTQQVGELRDVHIIH